MLHSCEVYLTRDIRLSLALVELFVDRDEKVVSRHRSPRVIALTDWVVPGGVVTSLSIFLF